MFLRILVVFSLILSATGLGVVGLQMMQPPAPPPPRVQVEAPPPPVAKAKVLVAARSLGVGTLLKDEDFRELEVPKDAVPEGAYLATPESRAELRGALLRRFVDPNTPVINTDVLRPRDRGFLAAVLKPGTRAISIAVDVVTGASGLIWPGDEVDLILTQSLPGGPGGPARRVVSETILAAVRVIAVDQQISQAGTEGTAGRVARTVTLEVTADDAERVSVATQLGRISLVVRSIEGIPEATAPRPSPVFGSDVSSVLNTPTNVSPAARMRVIQGGDQREVTFQ